jgi:HlyD family secretion protein
MKLSRIVSIVLFALVALAMGCQALPGFATSTPTAVPVSSKKEASANVISAEGTIMPIQRASLAFKLGGRVVQVRVKEGEVVQAGDVLARLDDAALKSQVAQAQAALSVAQKQLAQLRAGATPAERQAAKDALTAARAAYDKVKAGPTKEELAQLKANLDNAQAALAQAQFKYDRIGGASNPFGTAAPEALMLQQATNAFLAAQAALNDALRHPTDSELKSAAANVAQAESNVARLDPSPEAVALAEAQVTQAQAALEVAQVAAQDAQLVAPFAGTIAQVNVNVGDFATPGMPAIVLGDVSKLRVETTNLSEVDVAKVKPGQSVKVMLDAFANQTFHGTVIRIAPLANESRGDKVFRVWIDLQEGVESGLRWGMSANVEITAE